MSEEAEITQNEKFLDYHVENPQIWEEFEKYANQLADAGVTTLSANRIYERMRWETDIGAYTDGFKLTNTYRPYYARMWNEKYESSPSAFKCKPSYADELFG